MQVSRYVCHSMRRLCITRCRAHLKTMDSGPLLEGRPGKLEAPVWVVGASRSNVGCILLQGGFSYNFVLNCSGLPKLQRLTKQLFRLAECFEQSISKDLAHEILDNTQDHINHRDHYGSAITLEPKCVMLNQNHTQTTKPSCV